MGNLKLIVQYDGSGFHGFQMQPAVRTVQGELQRVLTTITDGPVRQYMAGRTDTGVHALGQVVNFHTACRLDTGTLLRGINALLPPDIAVRRVDRVAGDFHARFSAKRRTYVYVVDQSPVRSAFLSRYALHVAGELDHDAMGTAAGALVGEKDFASFRAAGDATRHSVRRMFAAGLWGSGPRIFFHFTANAFLQHMIRNIMGTLLWVGRGKISVEDFRGIVEARDRAAAGPAAGPQGLYFCRVDYEGTG